LFAALLRRVAYNPSIVNPNWGSCKKLSLCAQAKRGLAIPSASAGQALAMRARAAWTCPRICSGRAAENASVGEGLLPVAPGKMKKRLKKGSKKILAITEMLR
jgi:hypothetical protein